MGQEKEKSATNVYAQKQQISIWLLVNYFGAKMKKKKEMGLTFNWLDMQSEEGLPSINNRMLTVKSCKRAKSKLALYSLFSWRIYSPHDELKVLDDALSPIGMFPVQKQ